MLGASMQLWGAVSGLTDGVGKFYTLCGCRFLVNMIDHLDCFVPIHGEWTLWIQIAVSAAVLKLKLCWIAQHTMHCPSVDIVHCCMKKKCRIHHSHSSMLY
jgi:hypothetical protein